MKTTIVAIAMIMGLTLNAQTKEKTVTEKTVMPVERKAAALTPEERADVRVKRLTTELTLTEKQQKDIKQVLVTVETDKQKLLEENRANRKAGTKLTEEEKNTRKIKVLEQKIALDKEFKKILTAEQFVKYEQLKEEKKAVMSKGAQLKVEPSQK